MPKTIVSIISEQTIPNYLFIKEVFKNMGITYYGRSTFVDDNLFQGVINAIRKTSFD